MELAAVNAKTSGEAGTVITYFLGKNIPTGAQTVSVTVSDAVSKRAVATTVVTREQLENALSQVLELPRGERSVRPLLGQLLVGLK